MNIHRVPQTPRFPQRRRAFELLGAVLPIVVLVSAGLLSAPRVAAELSEPDHILYGTATADGLPVAAGLVTLVLDGGTQPIAVYEIGSDAALDGCNGGSETCYALRVPMDFGEPQRPETARPGDGASLFLDGQLAAEAVIGDPGETQLLDLDAAFVPLIPSLTITDAAGAESLAGPFGLDVAVSLLLSFASDDEVTVEWQTADGTATAGDDYTTAAGVATFAPGETLATVSVTVLDDATPEADPAQQIAGESFVVVLSNPVEAVLLDAAGTVTIVDDDTPPALALANLSVVEPPAGAVEAAFSVRLSGLWGEDVSFDYSGAADTAGAGDFELTPGTATIPAGSLSAEIGVRILADAEAEDDETFDLVLSNPVNASIRAGGGRCTILEESRFLTFVERQRDGAGGAEGLLGAIDVALSPGGEHLYVAGRGEDALAVFARDAATGRLAFIAAYRDGEGGLENLGGFEAVAVSPGGERVYAAAFDDGAVAAFERDPAAGTLTLIEVEREGGRDLESGATVEGLDGPLALAVAEDGAGGEHLYVAGSEGDALSVFHHDAASGLLSFEQVEKDDPGVNGLDRAVALALAPDGAQLYVASLEDDSVAVFDRDPVTGALSFVEAHFDGAGGADGLAGAAGVAVSPDGTSVYVIGQVDGGLAVFDRAAGGTLTFREALISGAGGVSGLAIATDVAVSGDGLYVYATGFADDALAVFERAGDGSLTPLEVELDGESGIDGLAGAVALAVSGDDRRVYAAGTLDDAVAVFRRDLTPPSAPSAFDSTSHLIGAFSQQAAIDLVWSGAGDAAGSGVAGYWLLLDGAPDTVPAAGAPSVFVPHGFDPHAATSDPQPDGERWAHLLTCDHAGNCAPPVHAGPFWVDATPPAAPAGLTSPSHGAAPSADDTIDALWDPAADAGSGVAGYALDFNLDQGFVCPGAPSQTATSATSAPLASGDWYVQVCAYDVAGNASGAATAGPLAIDLAGPAAPAGLVSPSHQPDQPSNVTALEIAWDPNGDPGLDGYAYQLDAAAAWVCDQAKDLEETATGVTLALAEGSWYFHVCALDLAGNASSVASLGPFVIDTTAPQDPISVASSSPPAVWTAADTVSVEWAGAIDASGVAGYSVLFDQAPATVPDVAIDIVHSSDPHATSSVPLADGGGHYFHLRTCDPAANCTSTVHLGPFLIDTVPPDPVTALDSTSHAVETPSADTTIDFTWAAAADATSGVVGYGYAAGGSPASPCEETDRGPATAFSSDPLAPGLWYVHVCAVDAAGLWSAVAGAGPFVIDAELIPPQVTAVGTVADTGDGVLAEGEATPAAITEILVRFSESVLDPAGDSDADDVTNPANYLLLADGGDGSFATASCAAGVHPTDAALAIDAVVYDDAVPAAALAVNGGPVLVEGRYRFMACGTTTIKDVTFNPLDGDADGTGGDDFVRGFIVDQTPPTAVSGLMSPSHGAAPSADDTIDALWTAAGDGLSGVAGYALDFNLDQGFACPAAPTQTATSAISAPLASGSWYVQVCAYDLAGNVSTVATAGPLVIDTGAPSPPAGLISPSHTPGQPSNVTLLEITWDPSADPGLDGYAYQLDVGAAWVCDRVKDLEETATGVTLAVAEGSRYFHLCALDDAGNASAVASLGPFVIDVTAPLDPTSVASPSHPPALWSITDTVSVEWSGAADANGVAGYSVLFDQAPSSLPDAAVDVVHASDPHSTSSAPLADGDGHYFHLRTCDLATNCTSTVHLGPFLIDITPPDPVANLASTSHVVAVPSSDPTVDTVWDAAADALSGVAGYAVDFNLDQGFACPAAPSQTATSATSAPLASGSWYVQVCAYDVAGIVSAVATAGPLVINTGAPAAPTGLMSPSHTPGQPSSLTALEIAWAPGAEPDLDGYAYQVDGNPAWVCDGMKDLEASATGVTVDLADGSWTFHACALDDAGNASAVASLGPFVIDTVAPAGTVAASTSHDPGVWSSLTAIAVEWSAAADTNGVAGYSFLFDTAAATVPDEAIDLDHGTDPHSTTSLPLADGDGYHFHLRACDVAGNCGAAVHLGPYRIDTLAPPVVTGLTSPSHGAAPTADATVDATWTAADDGLSGIAGYAVDFNLDQGFACPAAPSQTATSATSPPLASGSWYAQVCAYDFAGNVSGVVTAGPLVVDLDAPAAPANLSSPSHTPGEPSNLSALELTWDPTAGPNLDGYAYQVDANPAWICDLVKDLEETATGVTVTVTDGSWYFHACALDDAGNASAVASIGPFVIDTVAPAGPVAASTSHQPSLWSSQTAIAVEWSGASDANGVAGYSFLFDAVAATVPDETIDLAHGSDPHSTASAALADGDGHYFHLRTCDIANNCGAAVHLGPYWIETVAPSPVTALMSTSHPLGDTSTNQVIDIVWDASSDATSGLAGYAVEFDQSSDWGCDQVADAVAGATGTSSPTLADGTWYAHVCAGDEAGNWTAAATSGPYAISTVSATVTLVTTVADTGDGELRGREATTVPITQLYVDFSRPMADPAGDSSTVDVTNPASYLLVADGGDRIVDTTNCSTVDPADLGVTVDHVEYAATPRRATLWLDSVVPLPAARYRLFGCAAGLHDELDAPLDGDGNGTGGDDFSRDFEVLITNQLLNPNFDLDLGSWLAVSPAPGDVAHDSEDADALITSGSARIANSSGAIDEPYAISQCLPVTETDLLLRARLRIDSPFPAAPAAFALAEFFTDGACTEPAVASVATEAAVADSSGEWPELAVELEAPAGAASALVSFVVETGAATAFDVFYDVLYFGDSGLLFADGFESGGLDAWSNSTP